MNKEVKKKWVDALKSGEYRQCTGTLKKRETFCCLGVLCDLYRKESSKGEWVTLMGYRYFREGGISQNNNLHPKVMKWAELTSQNPKIGNCNEIHTASVWNDINKSSFNEIASMIEASL